MTYPQLSVALGGGHRASVLLLPSKEGLELSKTLQLPTSEDGRTIGPVQVITESEQELVLLKAEDEFGGKGVTGCSLTS